MNIAKNVINRNKKYLKPLIFLLIIGLILSILIYSKIDKTNLLNEIKNIETYLNGNHINFIYIHSITLIILIITSILLIGIIVFPIYYIFEIICIFFNIFAFSSAYKLNGFIYSILYVTLTKLIYLILLLIIFKKVFSILKNIIKNYKTKEYKLPIKNNIKQLIVCTALILIYDIFLYFWGSSILKSLLFILK